MKLYTFGCDPSSDLLMAQWWLRMRTDGDLDKTFLASAHCLSGFMEIWRNTELMLEVDDEGIVVAGWVQPFMGSGMFGLWVRSDKRHNLATVRKVLTMYRHIFDAGIGSIVGITKQEALLPEHEKLGYKVLGKVPKLWDKNNDGYVVVLSAEDFYANWGHDERNTTIPEGLTIEPRYAMGAQ